MRSLSYLSLQWYKEQNRQVVFIYKNNGLRPIIKILQNYFSLSNKNNLVTLEKSCLYLERAKRYWNAAQRHILTLKCVNFVNFVNFCKKIPPLCDGIFLFLLSRIYSLPSTSGTPEGQLEQPQASGTREALWNGPPLTRGVRGVFRSLFWRRLGLGRVVRLLERAEEGCEGLKHGCYDLPCVYFLIFLCHDIKNKIDMLVFNKEQN